jgi:hypothetical protein
MINELRRNGKASRRRIPAQNWRIKMPEVDTTNGAAAPTNGAQPPPSEEEINAIAGAARDLIPVMRFVGRPLNHGWENGVWYWKPDRDHEEKVGATEAYVVDLRSPGEVWKRWGLLDNGRRGVVDQIGGRYVDGWRNPPRHAMPEADENFDDDPWKENSWIVFKRLSDGQLLTWSPIYGAREGMGEFLDTAAKQWREHIGCMPVVLLESVPDGKSFKPKLRIIGWEAFGEGESPPADPARGALLRNKLEELRQKYAAPKGTAPKGDKKPGAGKRGDMDDEIPF